MNGAGSTTNAIVFGGNTPPDNTKTGKTEVWDGSSWSESGDLNSPGIVMAGGGTYTSASCYGGERPAYSDGKNEWWNGTSWTESADMNTGRALLGGSGANNTVQIAAGGYSTPPATYHAQTETWNGSSWTEVNDLNTARRGLGVNGPTSATIAYGGRTPAAIVANTELWNGNSWVETSDLNTATQTSGDLGVGSSTSALQMGGSTPGNPSGDSKVEEWSSTSTTIKVLTD